MDGKHYAKLHWHTDDIRSLRPEWETEQAEEFLEKYQDELYDASLQGGWEYLHSEIGCTYDLIPKTEENCPEKVEPLSDSEMIKYIHNTIRDTISNALVMGAHLLDIHSLQQALQYTKTLTEK